MNKNGIMIILGTVGAIASAIAGYAIVNEIGKAKDDARQELVKEQKRRAQLSRSEDDQDILDQYAKMRSKFSEIQADEDRRVRTMLDDMPAYAEALKDCDKAEEKLNRAKSNLKDLRKAYKELESKSFEAEVESGDSTIKVAVQDNSKLVEAQKHVNDAKEEVDKYAARVDRCKQDIKKMRRKCSDDVISARSQETKDQIAAYNYLKKRSDDILETEAQSIDRTPELSVDNVAQSLFNRGWSSSSFLGLFVVFAVSNLAIVAFAAYKIIPIVNGMLSIERGLRKG